MEEIPATLPRVKPVDAVVADAEATLAEARVFLADLSPAVRSAQAELNRDKARKPHTPATVAAAPPVDRPAWTPAGTADLRGASRRRAQSR